MAMHSQSLAHEDVDFCSSGDSDRLSKAMAEVVGLSIHEDYRGTLDLGKAQAEVRFEPHQWLRISVAVDAPPDPHDALRNNHWLSGNLRYAGSSKHMMLVADTQVNGVAHLAASLEEMRRGMADALGGQVWLRQIKSADGEKQAWAPDEPGQQKLETELNSLPFGPDSLVRRLSARGCGLWEIRPRIQSNVIPVLLDQLSDGVRLHRTLVSKPPTAHRDAINDQALRLNKQIRLCRLAWCGDELVAETLLNAELIETPWLTSATMAVAAASHDATCSCCAKASSRFFA